MDKYEYQVCADQIKSLIKERRFKDAMEIADTIDWRRVKSFSMLCTVSEIYKITKHYSESRDILLLAYERYPDRPNVVYALCELAIKLDDISDAIGYYKEYVRLKPHDTNKYVLLYKIYDAQDVPLEEKISLLEEYKKAEYTEKWAYELALLYHKDGQETKCVETCDELVLWFGEGSYVRKALELKMQHATLTKEQQSKYDGTYVKPVSTSDSLDDFDGQENQVSQPVNKFSTRKPYSDISVKPVSTDKYSTMNLEAEIAKNMEELYARDRREAPSSVFSSTSQLYELSQEQFESQLNQAGQPVYGQAPEQTVQQNNQAQPAGQMTMPQMNQSAFYGQNPYAVYGMNQPMFGTPQIQYDMYGRPIGQYYPPTGMTMPMGNQPYQSTGAMMPMGGQPYQPAAMPAGKQPYQQAPSVMSTEDKAVKSEVNNATQQDSVYQNSQQSVGAINDNIQQPTEKTEDVVEFANSNENQPMKVSEDIQDDSANMINSSVQEENSTTVAPGVVVASSNSAFNGNNAGGISTAYSRIPEYVEEQHVEEQVPGQMDLSDFMKDIEAKRRNGEEQRRAQARKKALENTSDYLSQLVGVIPGIDKEFESSQAVASSINAGVAPLAKVSEEVIKDDKKGVVTRTTIPSPIFDKEVIEGFSQTGPLMDIEPQPVVVPAPAAAEIPDVLPSASDILPSGYRTTLEDEYGGEIARIRKEDEEKVKRLTGELPPIEEEEDELPEEPDYGEAEEIEEVEQPEIEEPEEEDDSEYEEDDEENPVGGSIPPLEIESDDSDDEEDIEDSEDEDEDDSDDEEDEDSKDEDEDNSDDEEDEDSEDKDEDDSDDEDSEDEDEDDLEIEIKYPYEVDDIGEVEDMEDIDQPEDIEEDESNYDVDAKARERYEAGIEDEESREIEEEPSSRKNSRPSYMVMGEEARSRRDFDESEVEIFGRYEGIESVKAQIVDVIDDMSMDSYHGNVVVMGSELFGRKDIAIDIVRAIQRMDSSFSGKVAKISGEALKKKNISSTLAKLENGALVVENAGSLDSYTLNNIVDELDASDSLILVVLEDEKEALEPLLTVCSGAKSVFNARITVDDFNDDNLVSYAKGYAREEGYSIDEMGTLALHTRIAEMQTHDHMVSVDEVIEIIDNAIRHVDRKNMSHFMDVLFAKRYDDDDYIVLREKDFLY